MPFFRCRKCEGNHATPEHKLICPVCGKRFMSSRMLREHRGSRFSHLSDEEYLKFTTGRW